MQRRQGRREPRMGPGTALILRVSGFVQPKTGKENVTLFSGFSGDLKKKGLLCFISMGLMKPIGPSHEPFQAHGPPKIHKPRGHCPPCPSPTLYGPERRVVLVASETSVSVASAGKLF